MALPHFGKTEVSGGRLKGRAEKNINKDQNNLINPFKARQIPQFLWNMTLTKD